MGCFTTPQAGLWVLVRMTAYLPSRIILYTYNEQSIQLRPNVGFFKANDSCRHFISSSGLSEYETVPLLIAVPEHAVSGYLLRPVGRVHHLLYYTVESDLVLAQRLTLYIIFFESFESDGIISNITFPSNFIFEYNL